MKTKRTVYICNRSMTVTEGRHKLVAVNKKFEVQTSQTDTSRQQPDEQIDRQTDTAVGFSVRPASLLVCFTV